MTVAASSVRYVTILRASDFGSNPRGVKKALVSGWRSVQQAFGRKNVSGLWLTANGATFIRAAANASADGPLGAAASTTAPRVCILGGGFGGLYTAVKLEGLLWPRGTKPQITLIDRAERFTFKPLLYEVLTGAANADEVAPMYSQLLAPYPITFVQGRVASVRPDRLLADGGSEGGGEILLDSGDTVPYDWLVLALGAEPETFGIPGVKEHAMPFSTYADADALATILTELDNRPALPEVTIVGGGYAGVELAAAVSDRLGGRGRIKLITATSDILEGSPEGQRDAAKKALQDAGISVLAGGVVTEIKLAQAGGKRVVYVKDPDGQTEIIESDVVVWVAGQSPTGQRQKGAGGPDLPFPTNKRGATETEPTLRVVHHRNVFALGDVAVAGGENLPATAQVAFQQADYVAWNLWSSINDRPLLRFRYQHLGEMMSLGSTKGAVSLPIPIPGPIASAVEAGPLGSLFKAVGVNLGGDYASASEGVTVDGPLAAVLRRAAYLYRQPTDQQRLRVAASWVQQAGSQAAELARKTLAGGDNTRSS